MLPITPEEQIDLANLRKRARRRGIVVKSSRQPLGELNAGGLMVLDAARQTVIAGPTFNLSVAAAERAVVEHIERFEAEFLAQAALVR